MPERRILLGVVGRPHGVRGLVHLHSYCADPEDLTAYGALTDETGRAWAVSWRGTGVAELRDAAGRAVADRTAAERLVNVRLYIERDRLPATELDEFYLADLVGLDAGPHGHVVAVHDYGAGASLELTDGVFVPFTAACVPDVDLAAGRVVIVLPDEVVVRAAAPPSNPLPEGNGFSPPLGENWRESRRAPGARQE